MKVSFLKVKLARVAMALALFLTIGCATFSDSQEDQPPVITSKTPIGEAVRASVKFGGKTLEKAKKVFTNRKRWAQVGKVVQNTIVDDSETFTAKQLLNATNLYLSAKPKTGIPVFRVLVKDERILAKQIAWHLAATIPSKKMQKEIDNTVSRLLAEGLLSEHFIAEFAHALKNNVLRSHYTVARQGLFVSNLPEFVEAMILLSSNQASVDLMDYLARAPVEELRQLHMSTVNVYAAMEALEHLKANPVSSSHAGFEHLFLYSISRNTALSELAQDVLSNYLVADKEHLSMLLAKQPTWIQLAFVENAGRNLTRSLKVFLSELEMVTAKSSVVEEIRAIRR